MFRIALNIAEYELLKVFIWVSLKKRSSETEEVKNLRSIWIKLIKASKETREELVA
jgi:hypothetical protein